MEALTLPEPARQLWLETRDVLCSLGAGGRPWTPYLGGGTILAALWGHRQSTDIDVVIRETSSLAAIVWDDDDNVGRRIGGRVIQAQSGRIRIVKGSGVIDLNTAPVAPRSGAYRARIDGRAQHVLSVTQILRGKFERAQQPGPVRDAYDVVTAARRAPADLAAAYGLVRDGEKAAIERSWARLDGRFETEAAAALKLTGEPEVELDRIGSTAAQALRDHRLARVVIVLNDQYVTTERTTANGRTFSDRRHQRRVAALWGRNGIREVLDQAGVTTRAIIDHIATCGLDGRNGVVFDSAEPRPHERLSRRGK